MARERLPESEPRAIDAEQVSGRGRVRAEVGANGRVGVCRDRVDRHDVGRRRVDDDPRLGEPDPERAVQALV